MSTEVRRPLAGYTIGITGHRRWEEQAEMLSRRGARVVHGPTMSTAATERQLDAVTFTCWYAVHNAFELSTDAAALATAFGDGVLAVAIGPVTAEALREQGVGRVVEPVRARLGSMVHALVGCLEERATTLRHGRAAARWQGLVLLHDDGGETELTRGEARLLSVLVQRAPTVVPKAVLVEHGSDDHAAEAAVARLRAKLGPLGTGIRTVRRRGYACVLEVGRSPSR